MAPTPYEDLVEGLVTPRVVVLVGASGTGKTTLRRRLVAAGLPAGLVVSLDDLRRAARAEDVARGRPPRLLQSYSAAAVRRATVEVDALTALGTGYLADATHLVRRERRVHLRAAQRAGLPSVAVLTPLVELTVLLERNRLRPPDEQVPEEALTRQHRRRSLLSAETLGEEGFTAVHEL